ncbi:phenol-soluble modulin export ABC transporter permease subunit PmtB [Staphylococcus americanisciuri]|uniref:ABC-2 transporter permease n=1 Tax=Staphylococcus americanisciuri TaxID=2973940 RepID=A0ABT2F391_9STAP|nr:ABC-2 transporter permease [Staphylococcus americanisciuri]MCS4486938.1 ABC-2 transporter permease [Staphylococcus americanisciuri]
MLNLMKRNLYLHKNMLILYLVLLVFYPIYHALKADYELWLIPIWLIVVMIAIINTAHAYHLYSRFGHNEAYLFHHSLPVSKRQLLNAHYMTVIGLTLLSALLIILYDANKNYIEVNKIQFEFVWCFLATNLFAFIIYFPISSEKSRKRRDSVIIYIIGLLIVLPLFIGIVAMAIGMVWYDNPNQFAHVPFDLYYFGVSVVSAVGTYISQMLRIKNT